MTKEAYYKRNWTPGPPSKRILDHTHQPYDYLIAMWKDSFSSTWRSKDNFYLIDSKGRRKEIDEQWYAVLLNMDRNDYNMYHRWFRNEIHFTDEDYIWMTFKLPDNQRHGLDEKQHLIRPFLSNLTAKQRATYYDLCVGLKQVEIAKKRDVSKNAINNIKRALIKKLQKELLENGILGGN